MALKRNKPPAIEQEAKDFVKSKSNTTEKVLDVVLPTTRVQLAASALAGLLASGGIARAEELVTEAFRYADLLLNHKD
jgi:hypothetical protein